MAVLGCRSLVLVIIIIHHLLQCSFHLLHKEPDDLHLNGPKLWVAITLFDIVTSLTLPSHMRPLLGAEVSVIIISKYPLSKNALAPSPAQDV